MSVYDITLERVLASAQSISAFIPMVSEIEGELQVLGALSRCDIPDAIDEDGFPERSWTMFHISELLGHITEAKLLPDTLSSRFIPELIALGEHAWPEAWEYGFRKGVEYAKYSVCSED